MFLQDLPQAAQSLIGSLDPLSANSKTVLTLRYLTKDDNGVINEDTDGLYWRVASTIAKESAKFGLTEDEVLGRQLDYLRLMRGGFWLPNSPTLSNAGTRTGQMSACFVIPVKDAFSNGSDGIYDALTKAQLIQQTGGGVGYAFTSLREMGALVNTTKGFASGPTTFMEVYDAACQAMKQGGTRRGAQMGILRLNHPDIVTNPDLKGHIGFVEYKTDLTKLTNFNVSVSVSNAELAKITGEDPDPNFELVSPATGPTGKFLNAQTVFNQIVERAWGSGEPGLVFIERMNEHNPTPGLGDYEATNPCGEQPLVPYESCNLGSIVLDRYVVDGVFNWAAFEADTRLAITAMDDIVDANAYVPGVPEIAEVTKQSRKLGLGHMGQARMLFKLGLGYHTEEGRNFSAYVYGLMDVVSKEQSVELAKERGAYPYFIANWDESTAFFTKDWTERAEQAAAMGFEDLRDRYLALIPLMRQHGMRNSTTTTLAPTGTISIIADTSGGCEPEFALYISRWQAGVEMVELNPVLMKELEKRNFSVEGRETVAKALKKYRGSLREALAAKAFDYNPEGAWLGEIAIRDLTELAEYYVVSGDIRPADHVKMQGYLQRFCDSAISKTINFPNEATVEDVREAYLLAIELGCKGITVYRDGSRSNQPLTAGEKKAAEVMATVAEKDAEIATLKDQVENLEFQMTKGTVDVVLNRKRHRDQKLFGFTERRETGDGRLYLTLNYDAEGPREIFAEVGKAGGVIYSLTQALGRVISLALQYHTPLQEIAKQLKGIRSANPHGFGPNQVLSIPDAMGQVLAAAPDHLFASTADDMTEPQPVILDDAPRAVVHADARLTAIANGENPECPTCHAPMKFGEGCKGGSCTNVACGFAKC